MNLTSTKSILEKINHPDLSHKDVTNVSYFSQSLFTLYKVEFLQHRPILLKEINSKEMATSESSALSILDKLNVPVPHYYGFAELDKIHYIAMDWIEIRRDVINHVPTIYNTLEKLYSNTNSKWGWGSNNFIGTLFQKNQFHNTFSSFFWLDRIEPLVKLAITNRLLNTFYSKKLESIIHSKIQEWGIEKTKPTLIHGDLWSGNVIPGIDNVTYLIDPCLSYSHLEQDLGMAFMFGGIASKQLVDQLQIKFNLQDGVMERIPFWQIYPVLVHINIFGTSYISSLDRIIKTYI